MGKRARGKFSVFSLKYQIEGGPELRAELEWSSVPHKIVFVCSANMCRSPMAHAILEAEASRRGLAIIVGSAGIWDFEGELAAMDARVTCENHHTPMPKLLSTYLANLELNDATRIFVMERAHLEEVLAKTAVPPERVNLLGEFDPEEGEKEIEDPIGQDLAAFSACYERLRNCILHYLDTTADFNPLMPK